MWELFVEVRGCVHGTYASGKVSKEAQKMRILMYYVYARVWGKGSKKPKNLRAYYVHGPVENLGFVAKRTAVLVTMPWMLTGSGEAKSWTSRKDRARKVLQALHREGVP